MVLRASTLPPQPAPCFLSIILEHWVLGQQFCPQDVCLQALPSKSQSSRLPLTIQTPKWERGENPWAVLLIPNKVYLYSKIATGYLSLQKLKRLGSLNFKILSLWEVEVQVSENGHQKHVLTAPLAYFMVSFHKYQLLFLWARWTTQRVNAWLLSHEAKIYVKHMYIEIQDDQPKLRSLGKFLQTFQSLYILRSVWDSNDSIWNNYIWKNDFKILWYVCSGSR